VVGPAVQLFHALVGGLIGRWSLESGTSYFGLAKIGSTAAFIFPVALSRLSRFIASGDHRVLAVPQGHARARGKWFRRLQPSVLGHAQRQPRRQRRTQTMGIIAALLYSQGLLAEDFHTAGRIPVWIVLSCYLAMGLGTWLVAGASSKTMECGLTKFVLFTDSVPEAGGSLAIFIATSMDSRVTTHTITGSLWEWAGVQPGRVRWGVAQSHSVGLDSFTISRPQPAHRLP